MLTLFTEILRFIINSIGTVLCWAVFFVLLGCIVELIFVGTEEKRHGRDQR